MLGSNLTFAEAPATDFDALENAPKVEIPIVAFHKSYDETKLAYYKFNSTEQSDRAVIVLHGGGAHSLSGYQHLADTLSREYSTNVYLVDLRGHGRSKGRRGDAPRANSIKKDLKSFVKFTKKQNKLVYVLGHSSGAGLLLNYISWKKKIEVDGYFFVSPQFGHKAKIERDNPTTPPFATIKLYKFIIAQSTFGLFYGHSPAVHFNYPAKVLARDPLINTFITRHMSVGMTPKKPVKQFKKIDQKYGLFTGERDNLLDPLKVTKYCDYATEDINKQSACEILYQGHLSILLKVGHNVGELILNWN
ncbi:hypothetical protein A9Q84_02995 [Halobacteriovorax marinus]|uniref:Serine aminopeptidase S33 domain-containing protein n=1 Tax=Halobacteriovorax marinus TaxID=97084 RepID=A0A1Y5FDH3_9BACT|nr:hypothetical protein A9Q84_02995 [Halobacteriovorax marinus]